MERIAWFSPLPPVRSGIASYSSDLLLALASQYEIDLFVDGSPMAPELVRERRQLFDAHDFIWKNRARPYNLIVYQLGNATCHDYMWAYMVRYPGLVVLHDGQLHHARARMLLQQRIPKRDEYRQEFWFNHPDANPDLAELGAAGLLGSLTYSWPMLRVVVEASRRLLVHNDSLAEYIRDAHPAAKIDVVEMGVPDVMVPLSARERIRSRHGIAENTVVFAALGKVTPEKRVREAMRALAFVVDGAPRTHFLIAGETVEYYDLAAEADALGIRDRVTFAGYVPDAEIGDYIAASDICLCLRWPTSRETSASWLRCLAAGKPTITTDLVHTVDIATLDPRNWAVLTTGATEAGPRASTTPVGVSIDILDEGHSLKLAIRRLATDEPLRATLGSNARALWEERFRLEKMVAGYQRVIAELVQTAPQDVATRETFPLHLRSSGTEYAETLMREILGPEYHLRDVD